MPSEVTRLEQARPEQAPPPPPTLSQAAPMEPSVAQRPSITSRDPEPGPLASPPPAAIAAPATPDQVGSLAELQHAPAIEVAAPRRGDERPPDARPRRTETRPPAVAPVPAPSREVPARGAHQIENGDAERGTTAPQLRRFIKSRAYVPMHELRRRFAINGADDEVTAVDVERRRVFVGLPEREGRLLGELLRGGDIGYELSLDPITPIVVGVYPMRPVTRV
jgi:hypothetical protein